MTTIINFVPAYKDRPVALELLKKDVSAAAEVIKGVIKDTDGAVIMPSGVPELTEQLSVQLEGVARVVEETLPNLGFVYSNDTAALRVLNGEKPLPSEVTGKSKEFLLVDGGNLLSSDGKRAVWFKEADAPVELPAKICIGDLVAASGVTDAKAVYVGYPVGEFFSTSDLLQEVELNTDYVDVYDNKKCMAQALNEVCQMYRHETCGRCVYGHEGGYQTATIIADICRNKGKSSDVELLKDHCPTMETECLCEMGRVMGHTVTSALASFGPAIEAHFTKHVCSAGECSAYMTYHILPNLCSGCGECLDVCEEDAILGKSRFVHVIDQKACTKCGQCLPICEEKAIIMAGADKPRTPPRPIPIRRR